jgi:hypothetical protein
MANPFGVCSDQLTFNNALSTGLDAYTDSKQPKKGIIIAVSVTWAVLLVVAVIIALHADVPDHSHRVYHLFFALLAPPIYVIAYLFGMMGQKM